MGKEDRKPRIPRELLNEKRTVRLFMAYLRQQATQDALLAKARDLGLLSEYSNYLHTLTVRVDGDKYLEELVMIAPAFAAVVNLGYHVSDSVLLVKPSRQCLDAAMREYHAWVRRSS